jgi:hypothetical protein
MVPLYVADGGVDDKHKIVWVVWTNGVGVLFLWLLPSFANQVSTLSLLTVLVREHVLCV